MKTRHIALFGLDASNGEDDVTNLERDFYPYLFLHLAISPATTVEPCFLHFRYRLFLETKERNFNE